MNAALWDRAFDTFQSPTAELRGNADRDFVEALRPYLDGSTPLSQLKPHLDRIREPREGKPELSSERINETLGNAWLAAFPEIADSDLHAGFSPVGLRSFRMRLGAVARAMIEGNHEPAIVQARVLALATVPREGKPSPLVGQLQRMFREEAESLRTLHAYSSQLNAVFSRRADRLPNYSQRLHTFEMYERLARGNAVSSVWSVLNADDLLTPSGPYANVLFARDLADKLFLNWDTGQPIPFVPYPYPSVFRANVPTAPASPVTSDAAGSVRSRGGSGDSGFPVSTASVSPASSIHSLENTTWVAGYRPPAGTTHWALDANGTPIFQTASGWSAGIAAPASVSIAPIVEPAPVWLQRQPVRQRLLFRRR